MIICEHDEDQRYQFHDGAKNSTAGRMTFYELELERRNLYDAHRLLSSHEIGYQL